MKLTVISDTHGQHRELPVGSGDIIIHAGDISRIGKREEVVDFLHWFDQLDFNHKVFIAGNHDFLFERDPISARALIPKGINYLEDTHVEIEGLKIYGSILVVTTTLVAFAQQPATVDLVFVPHNLSRGHF